MHFHPDSILPSAYFQGACPARHPKVPMVAPSAAGQLALALHDETAPAALVEGLVGCELEIELEHSGL